MRRVIAWALYGAGHIASKCMVECLGMTVGLVIYRIYNRLMVASMNVQGDGPDPWREPA